METLAVIGLAATALATTAAWYFYSRSRLLAQAIDDARGRIGGEPPSRKRLRSEALDTALQRLERSSSQAQKERSQLAGALQAATAGVVITDDHGVITFANGAADRLVGARQGETLDEPRLRDAIEKAVLERSPVSTELDLGAPMRLNLEIEAIALDFGVESVGAVAFIHDVSDQRRVEAMRRDFIANASDELKTPLSSLAALAETIAGSLDDADIAERLAGRLEAQAARLTALVDDILDLSRAEALANQGATVHVTELVNAVVAAAGERAAEKGVELVTGDVPDGARVAGDRRQLQNMLSRLVENAITYSDPQQGHAPPRVWLRISLQDAHVILEVQDEGIGIAEGHADRIFERFYRVDRERSEATDATGLGLSIVRHIARSHGGEVTVMSKPGEGSIFTVRLPREAG